MKKRGRTVGLIVGVVAVICMIIPAATPAAAAGFPLSRSDSRIQAALDFIRNSEEQHADLWTDMEKACYAITAVEACGADSHTFTNSEGESLVDIIRENAASLLQPQASASLPHEFYLFAIVAAGENPRNFAGIDVVQQLKDMFDGSQIGMPNIINDDFWAIITLVGAGESPGSTIIQTSKNHILNNQSPDGGWGSAVGGTGSDPCDTANAIMALRAAGESPSSTAIQNGLAYIKSTQRDDGGFPYMEGYSSDTGSDARVIAALWSCGIDPTSGEWSKNGQNAVSHALSQQQPDGGFAWYSGGATDAWMTTYIMPALAGKHWPPDLFSGTAPSPTTTPPTSSPSTVPSVPPSTTPVEDHTAPSVSDLSPSPQETVNETIPTVGAAYFDTGSGINTSSVILKVDTVDVTASANITESYISYTPPLPLENGTHTIELIVDDLEGNHTLIKWSFNIGQSTMPPSLASVVGDDGVLGQTIELTSEDERVCLILPQGIRILEKDGGVVTQVGIDKAVARPDSAPDFVPIGPVYRFVPEGVMLEPSALITVTYSEGISGDSFIWDVNGDGSLNALDIMILTAGTYRENIREDNFVLARYDEQNGGWLELPGSRVDTAGNTVTATLDYLAPVAIMGKLEDSQPLGTVASLSDDTLASPDGLAELHIFEGTTIQSSAEISLILSDIDILTLNPELPGDLCRLGPVYELEPVDASLGTPARLTLHYQEVLLSEVIRWDTNGDGIVDLLDDAVVTAPDDFYIARFDTTSDSWKPLQSEVNRSEKTVTAEITESGYYALVGPATSPFVVHGIEVTPAEVNLGEDMVFQVSVENPGDSRGTFIIPLEIDGFPETSQEVTLAPGIHQITFTHREPYAGTHEVAVLGVTSEFTVNQVTTDEGSWWDSIDIVFWLYVIIGILCVIIITGSIVLARIWRREDIR